MVNNILIIGITGNGKSALANLLTDTNEFGESSSSTSVTKDFQKSKPFEWKGKKYCVIDNIGFGDTNKISREDILLKIGEGIYSAQEGINQVLFVFGGRFGPEHVKAFSEFKRFISESKITEFTTLVRTKFPSFRDQEECKKDRQNLLSEDNKDLRETVRSCSFVHVDNPSMPERDEEDSDNEEEINISNEKREASRKIVLDHLIENCQNTYKFKKWDSIYADVANYIEKKQKIEKGNSLVKKRELEKMRNEIIKNIKDNLSEGLSSVIEQK